MRFTEIANPEDQLALWRMVSDSMWKAFGQPTQTNFSLSVYANFQVPGTSKEPSLL